MKLTKLKVFCVFPPRDLAQLPLPVPIVCA